MNSEITFIVNTIQKELWLRWKLGLFFFVTTGMIFQTAAVMWPKVYTSSSVVLVDQQSILSPLMQGTAVATEARNRAKIAQQVIFGQKSMEQIIRSETWAGDDYESLSLKDIERYKIEIFSQADVTDVGQNLIEISYEDSDANKAHQTASLLTDIFIQESINAKQEESSSAYSFIDEQVTIYQDKLRMAENAIKRFRANNVDATEGTKINANARLVELKREKESHELEVSAEKSSIDGNNKRLTGEVSAESNASFMNENDLELRIRELLKRLDDLRLSYKETYPDIQQIKGQIQALQKEQVLEGNKRDAASKSGYRNIPTGTIAQDLKRSILISESSIISLYSKIDQLQRLIDKERDTITLINEVEAEVAELNRDYQVNQTMYQDLLAQRENARVSMNMDLKNQGMTIRIQDPATLPAIPEGIRFLHIILAGLIVSILLPIALIYGITLLDQKVRNEFYLRDELRLPILGSVYSRKTPVEKRNNIAKLILIGVIVLSVWSIYGYSIISKIQG